MSEAFIGEIRMFGFNFAPRNWALCDGQILSIAQNTALFSLLGTMYGGNGQTTFALPNLQGRAPVHRSGGMTSGETGGEAAHTLTQAEAQHTHALRASVNQGSTPSPANNVLAAKRRGGKDIYNPTVNAQLDPASVSPVAGSDQPHSNMQPYLGLHFAICLAGIFPSRN